MQWRFLIEAARRWYDRRATTRDRELLDAGVRGFFDFACERIRESLGSPGRQDVGKNGFHPFLRDACG